MTNIDDLKRRAQQALKIHAEAHKKPNSWEEYSPAFLDYEGGQVTHVNDALCDLGRMVVPDFARIVLALIEWAETTDQGKAAAQVLDILAGKGPGK